MITIFASYNTPLKQITAARVRSAGQSSFWDSLMHMTLISKMHF